MIGRGLRAFWLPMFAGVALAVLGVQLGQWQLRRASEKAELQREIDRRAAAPARDWPAGESPADWTVLRLRGRWRAEHMLLVDNRPHHGRPGYHVAAPLELADGRLVVVNRGWVAAPADRRVLPAVDFPAGEVLLEGVARRPARAPFRLSEAEAPGRIRQHLEPAQFSDGLGGTLAEWVLWQHDGAPDGLLRDWPRPDAGIDRHRGYALQWFALAALSGGLTVFFGLRRGRRDDGA